MTIQIDALVAEVAERSFANVGDLIHEYAVAYGARAALVCDGETIDYATLDARVERFAAALQQAGVRPREAVAICAAGSIAYVVAFLGALRAGVAVAPLAPASTAQALAGMLANAEARLLFLDASVNEALDTLAQPPAMPRILLDGAPGGEPLEAWLASAPAEARRVEAEPAWPFNIIYSSGTTGQPKGIVQSHGMRWAYAQRSRARGYTAQSRTLIATPLYSNTTLVSFFPTLSFGGTVVLMPKFDATRYLELAERERVTHTMLVPVQYQRVMAHPDFDRYDLSSFKAKSCTSAPFAAALKADIVRRWPGTLTEYYGMTEGGGTCELNADQYPDKLHTVGRPAAGHDLRLIDAEGREVAQGEIGEVVGHSPAMMTGYFRDPARTAEAEWYAPDGKRFIRTGDVGRFDEDGFLTLLGRQKDMIISGGFNLYPSDLEQELIAHPAVQEAAVVGAASARWGETPVAFVVLRQGTHEAANAPDEKTLLDWVNARLGRMQRIAALAFVDALPRSDIGKVLKRALRERADALAAAHERA